MATAYLRQCVVGNRHPKRSTSGWIIEMFALMQTNSQFILGK
jgi:hypothetical protein